MEIERVRLPMSDGNGNEVWIVEDDVRTVKAMRTKHGNRLLLTLQGPEGQPVVWVEDNPYNRVVLKMEKHGGQIEPGSNDVAPGEIDDRIPF